MAENTEMFLKWCYINDKKDVVMVLDSNTFELLRNTLNKYQELTTSGLLHESDEWNYGYTRE